MCKHIFLSRPISWIYINNYRPICIYLSMYIHIYACLSIHLSIYLSTYISLSLSPRMSQSPHICLNLSINTNKPTRPYAYTNLRNPTGLCRHHYLQCANKTRISLPAAAARTSPPSRLPREAVPSAAGRAFDALIRCPAHIWRRNER